MQCGAAELNDRFPLQAAIRIAIRANEHKPFYTQLVFLTVNFMCLILYQQSFDLIILNFIVIEPSNRYLDNKMQVIFCKLFTNGHL